VFSLREKERGGREKERERKQEIMMKRRRPRGTPR
jgi:hypothetical protein